MVGTTRQQHTFFFLLCLFFLYMARARNTRDSTIPTPPSWGPTFSVAYLATDPSPVGRLPPLPLSYKGTWHYHWPLQRQRLEYNFYEESPESAGALERKEKTLVELWRGHEEVYVFSPTDRSCRLLDLWPDFTPLPPHWLNGHGTGEKKGREALYRGRAYDVMRSVQNGSEVLVEVERWEGGAEGGVGTAVPGIVAYFLSPPREDPGKVAQETRGKVDVPLRLLGPVPGWGEGGEGGREGGREGEAVRLFSFSDFSPQPPSETLFVLPSYCRNASVVVLPQDVGEGGREGGLGRLRVEALHTAFLSRGRGKEAAKE
ncbi:hypothetical protein NSK_001739 [Nannochloropsis salina CCMP1776]|uniref:Uncharacterized protein n=1 Tax=Nannochloropsis salina CCMP1776 TaxID=1027361 RepID=A0A4D9DAK5_9STRA|nr:hypothetical protein NSK_001739 [Nannochloropsis salina CCMP1776]|eukprot:TFJ87407.1 hypothetical protein NSK_001739 [Nannochloropsis salina CCMP1776]